jgi:hypothetical protein
MYVANDAVSVFAVSARYAASSLRRCSTPFNMKLSGVLLLGVIDVNAELATQGPECDLSKMITSMLDVECARHSYHIFLNKQLFSEEVFSSRGCHGRLKY